MQRSAVKRISLLCSPNNRSNGRSTAVEALEASKSRYVKTASVLSSKQTPVLRPRTRPEKQIAEDAGCGMETGEAPCENTSEPSERLPKSVNGTAQLPPSTPYTSAKSVNQQTETFSSSLLSSKARSTSFLNLFEASLSAIETGSGSLKRSNSAISVNNELHKTTVLVDIDIDGSDSPPEPPPRRRKSSHNSDKPSRCGGLVTPVVPPRRSSRLARLSSSSEPSHRLAIYSARQHASKAENEACTKPEQVSTFTQSVDCVDSKQTSSMDCSRPKTINTEKKIKPPIPKKPLGLLLRAEKASFPTRQGSTAVTVSTDSSRRSSSELEKFFSSMGLEHEVLQTVQDQTQETGSMLSSCGSFSTITHCAREKSVTSSSELHQTDSSQCLAAAISKETQLTTENLQLTREPGRVENNARVIKWLCGVRRAVSDLQPSKRPEQTERQKPSHRHTVL